MPGDQCDDCGYYWKAHPPSGGCPGPRLDRDPSDNALALSADHPHTTYFDYILKKDDEPPV